MVSQNFLLRQDIKLPSFFGIDILNDRRVQDGREKVRQLLSDISRDSTSKEDTSRDSTSKEGLYSSTSLVSLSGKNGFDRISLSQIEISRSVTSSLIFSKHPRAKALLDWIERNEVNKKWYLENVGNNFDLVEDGIEILGDIYCLDDEEADEDGVGIFKGDNGFTYFSLWAIQKHAKVNGKELTYCEDWDKIRKFIPGDFDNQMFFFLNVMNLKMAGRMTRSYNRRPKIEEHSKGEFYYITPNYNKPHDYIYFFTSNPKRKEIGFGHSHLHAIDNRSPENFYIARCKKARVKN